MDEPEEQLPEVIPVFPLAGALLLPGTHLPLHVFEPRYRHMVEDAIDGPGLIGMIQPRPRRPTALPPADLAPVGCVGRLIQVARTSEGRFLVVLEGVARFRAVDEVTGIRGYRRLRVSWAEFAGDRIGEADSVDSTPLLESLSRFIVEGPGCDALAELPAARQVNLLAAALPFGQIEKQALLEAPDTLSRRDLLVALLEMGLEEELDPVIN